MYRRGSTARLPQPLMIEVPAKLDTPGKIHEVLFRAGTDELLQSQMDDILFGSDASDVHRFLHQLVVDIDVRSHGCVSPCVWYDVRLSQSLRSSVRGPFVR